MIISPIKNFKKEYGCGQINRLIRELISRNRTVESKTASDAGLIGVAAMLPE